MTETAETPPAKRNPFKPRIEWLLVFVPIAFVLEFTHGPEVALFATAALAVLPLALLMGHATEELALRSGPQLGGFLNATFGNLAELIIAFFLIIEGQLAIVKASLTGAIIGNVLLILGLSFLVGGWKREHQKFSLASAGLHSSTLVIAVIALLMPALFFTAGEVTTFRTEAVSVGVSVVLIATYIFSLLFSMKTHRALFAHEGTHEKPTWSLRRGITTLAVATVFVAIMSEFLVGALEHTTEELGLSHLFVGLIIVPLISNAAEHASAIFLAAKDKMSVSIEIAIGSSVQIALFVAPVLVFMSLFTGNHLDLIFTGFEIAAVAFSAAILSFIALDGRSNWFEGVLLLSAYVIMAISFFFL
ncbi:MAG: calcium/proton exchanger [Actinomycetota bacterium]|nr:calcium/proton exchanger [Actinomycetota bacterium]